MHFGKLLCCPSNEDGECAGNSINSSCCFYTPSEANNKSNQYYF